MMQKHEKLLADLEFKINQLIYVCDTLREENLSLKALLEEKDLQIELVNAKLSQLNDKYQNLKVANSLLAQGDGNTVEETKAKLAKLIQDVEKCITLLKI